MVASTGGHLAELALLAPRLSPPDDETWITFDSTQSRLLLADRRVAYVEYSPPRDWPSVLRNTMRAVTLVRRTAAREIVTTGAGIALSFAPAALARRIPMHYIESAARTCAPSLTGRLLQGVPGVKLYAQAPSLTNSGKWHYSGSVFDGYRTVPASRPRDVRRVVVTVGSLDFSFKRLLARLRAIMPSRVAVLVQAGVDACDLDWPQATIVDYLPAHELAVAMAAADVIVAHCGIGSILGALQVGKVPLLVPRRRVYAEHVDDHQLDIASVLSERGLAVMVDAETATFDDLQHAASYVAGARSAPSFELS